MRSNRWTEAAAQSHGAGDRTRARRYETRPRLPQVFILGDACPSACTDVCDTVPDFRLNQMTVDRKSGCASGRPLPDTLQAYGRKWRGNRSDMPMAMRQGGR